MAMQGRKFTSEINALSLLPIIAFFALPTTFVISYVISIAKGHVHTAFPNISDTGNEPPESCVFSMFLNLTSGIIACVVYVRTKEITEYIRSTGLDEKIPSAYRVNTCSTLTGYFMCIGLDLAANFQEDNVRIVHDIGLLVFFILSAVYFILQSVISYWMCPRLSSKHMTFYRGSLATIIFLDVIVNQVTTGLAGGYFREHNSTVENNTNSFTNDWRPSDPTWNVHVASSISEWLLITLISFYIISFYSDFKRVTLYTPKLEMKEN